MRDFMERAKVRVQCAFLRGKMEMKELLEGEKGASDMVTVSSGNIQGAVVRVGRRFV